MDTLTRAKELKLALTDFVLDAEDEVATALETYSAAQLSRSQQTDLYRRELVVDRFLMEAQIGEQTPIDLFIAQEADLTESDRRLLQRWQRSFVGLFAVTQVLPDGLELMNWTTAKTYTVRLTEAELQAAAKLKEGDILLTQIVPLSDSDWMVSSKWIALGKLGKPKLAVAIGNFKQNYKEHLYSDAPDLLEEAWKSVERYHQDFTDFFGSGEITMSGYQLSKKLAEFQEVMTEKQLERSGIDHSKSVQELAEEAGISQEELEETATAMGADAKVVNQMLDAKQPTKMMAPKVELPPALKKAEQVTVLTDPRWGQVFSPHYAQFKASLAALTSNSTSPSTENTTPDSTADSTVGSLARKFLEDPAIPAFVWHQLAEQYPAQLEVVLRRVLERPDFNLLQDLDKVLQEFGKPLQPELPEIASVPIHLHNLFQAAVIEVSKDKSKKKIKSKTGTGFQR